MSGHDGESARTQKREIEITGPMKVDLSEASFMGFVVSSAEVFKRESPAPDLRRLPFTYPPVQRFGVI